MSKLTINDLVLLTNDEFNILLMNQIRNLKVLANVDNTNTKYFDIRTKIKQIYNSVGALECNELDDAKHQYINIMNTLPDVPNTGNTNNDYTTSRYSVVLDETRVTFDKLLVEALNKVVADSDSSMAKTIDHFHLTYPNNIYVTKLTGEVLRVTYHIDLDYATNTCKAVIYGVEGEQSSLVYTLTMSTELIVVYRRLVYIFADVAMV